jgi:tetratricopeptide (TPR) repeat protein
MPVEIQPKTVESARKPRWMQRGILGAVCALVIGIYAYTAHSGVYVSGGLTAAENSYNLLVEGFRAGQLSLKKDVPVGLTQLADPYDPTQNVLYRSPPYWVHDLSYYKGRLFLYWGITPALIVFWPYVALTGHYLSYAQAGVFCCAVGFLASMCLLLAIWRRYFERVSVWVVAAGGLALGLATGIPFLLAWCDIYEIAISCAYALVLIALAAIWNALHNPSHRRRWLVVASVAYGLAVGARPNLLFGAAILLVPVAQEWREKRKVFGPLLASTGPIVLITLGLILHNILRFSSPLEFGQHYQLGGSRLDTLQFFSLRYFWSYFRVYLLQPAHWSGRFPFVHIGGPLTFGILTNVPLVWLALAAVLACRNRPAQERSNLSAFLAAVAALVGIIALTLCAYAVAQGRYEVDFLSELVLLAVIGVLALERVLSDRPVWRRATRLGWSILLGFSVAFNLLLSTGRCADADYRTGAALSRLGRVQDAIGHFEQALRLNPEYAEAHNNLGVALLAQGRRQEAIGHWEQALRINPDLAEAHFNLGLAFVGQDRLHEAITCYEQALRIKPDYAEAHFNLGSALVRLGRQREAIEHWEQALRIKPDFVEAHYNLGVALEQAGRRQDAIQHYQQALRIEPDLVPAQKALARARTVQSASTPTAEKSR